MSEISEFEQAANDLAAIRELQKPGSAFRVYFLRRLDQKIDELKNSILHDHSLDAKEIEGKRNQLWGLEELRNMPDRDRTVCLNMDRSVMPR